ncbi:MAG: hypothetical protein ABIO76_11270 [Ginsengibacter sp.]
MFRFIQIVLCSLVLLLTFSSCEKEVSVENGGLNTGGTQSGTAIWTLDGAPIVCTTPLISGDYIVGTALDISNTVVITATVAVPGTYTISTGLINGIQFSGSGTFAATGTQTITLFGAGIPAIATSSNYVPGTNGCSFTITATTVTVTPVTGIYYEATIDGTVFRVDFNGTNGYDAGTGVSGTINDAILSSYILPSVTPMPAGTTSFELSKGILRNYTSIPNVTFKAFFSVGSSPYGYEPADGVRIFWTDGAGNQWSTNNAPADQTGSTFNITSVVDEPGQTDYTVRVNATFSCKLYDNAGNTKTLTAGTYVGLFSKL